MSGARVKNIAIDVNDLDAQAAFWGELLAMKVTSKDEDWWDLEPVSKGGPNLSLQLVPETKATKNRIHFDVGVTDIAAEVKRAVKLGATTLGPVMGPKDEPWRVMADPEGNEFCFVTG